MSLRLPPFAFVRMILAFACAVWVAVWSQTVWRLGAISRSWHYDIPLVLLALLQLVRPHWLRLAAGVLTVTVAVLLQTGSWVPGTLTPSAWWRSQGQSLLILLMQHQTTPLLSATLFSLIFPALYGLILYSSQYRGLWLFYQGIALVSAIAIERGTGLSMTFAVVILLAVAGVGLAAQAFFRLEQPEWRFGKQLRFLLPVLVLAVGIPACAALLPKPGGLLAAWGRHVRHWFQFHSEPILSLGPAPFNRVGFQSGIQWLGGSVAPNYTPVLSVIAPRPVYLRGQVYQSYTGRAWRSAVVGAGGGTRTQVTLPSVLVTQRLQWLGGGLHTRVVFGAYQIRQVRVAGVGTPGIVAIRSAADTWRVAHAFVPGQVYKVTSAVPVAPYAQLHDHSLPLSPKVRTWLARQFPQDLQVPFEFPERDRQLAARLAGHGQTEYQIVSTVQDYLRLHEHYALTHIPVPGPRTDYVDQFLFQTHRGYCNNFSTAMAMLLRSDGIPTRWVTGFAPGTLDETYVGPAHRYVIRDADAHSWVEVYFPHAGWIPFDATPGFRLEIAAARTAPTSMPAVAPRSTHPTVTPSGQGDRQPVAPPSTPGGLTQGQPRSTQASGTPHRAGAVFLGIATAAAIAFWGWLRRRQPNEWAAGRGARPTTDSSLALPPTQSAAASPEYWEAWRVAREWVDTCREGLVDQAAGRTLRQLSAAVPAEGLSAQERQLFVRLMETLWYRHQPLSAADLAVLSQLGSRWLAQLKARASALDGIH